MDDAIFTMYNNHSKSCGTPPVVSNKKSKNYYGYFENEHGEQWIFIYNRETKKAELRGGDTEWQNIFIVNNGFVKELILDSEESNWLQACWKSATRFER